MSRRPSYLSKASLARELDMANLRRSGLSAPQIGDIVGMSLATVQRYCRFADRKESGKAALVMLAERRKKKDVL